MKVIGQNEKGQLIISGEGKVIKTKMTVPMNDPVACLIHCCFVGDEEPDMDNENPALQRLDTLEPGTKFRWRGRLFDRGHIMYSAIGRADMSCWDTDRHQPECFNPATMVEPIDTQGDIEAAFGLTISMIATMRRKIKELIADGRLEDCNAGGLFHETDRLECQVNKTHETLRNKKPQAETIETDVDPRKNKCRDCCNGTGFYMCDSCLANQED